MGQATPDARLMGQATPDARLMGQVAPDAWMYVPAASLKDNNQDTKPAESARAARTQDQAGALPDDILNPGPVSSGPSWHSN